MTDWTEILRKPSGEHQITPEQAKEWIAAYQNRAVVATSIRSWTWPISVYEALCTVPRSKGVREYLGVKPVTRKVDGINRAVEEVCPILVAVDETGTEMWEAGVYEIAVPCPPAC